MFGQMTYPHLLLHVSISVIVRKSETKRVSHMSSATLGLGAFHSASDDTHNEV